jgi:uncharacterized protein (DUF1800 family)
MSAAGITASAPAAPVTQEQRRVARLFHRAGFGATVDEINSWAAQGYPAAVDHLLGFAPASSSTRVADEAQVTVVVKAAEQDDAQGRAIPDITAYARWWLDRMATGPYPLEEKLTLYWHRHFATGYQKVDLFGPMLAQNKLLRDLAAGSFRDLCKQVTADVAMLLYLDGERNEVNAINENYGREFMELFTLGRNNGYTQNDVVAAARCFTGYTVNQATNSSTFNASLHDQQPKTLLGHTGNWQPADVTDIVLDGTAVAGASATYLANRMAQSLHQPSPESTVVSAMSSALVSNGYQVAPMVRALLLSPEFMDGAPLGIKSPVELVASVIRALGLGKAPTGTPNAWAYYAGITGDELARYAEGMGQALFIPPNVAGWPGGSSWVNTAFMLNRYDFAVRAAQLVNRSVVDKALAIAGGQAPKTQDYWMNVLGLLELSADTAAAIQQYTGTAAANGDSADTVSRSVLTLLIASPDFNLR